MSLTLHVAAGRAIDLHPCEQCEPSHTHAPGRWLVVRHEEPEGFATRVWLNAGELTHLGRAMVSAGHELNTRPDETPVHGNGPASSEE